MRATNSDSIEARLANAQALFQDNHPAAAEAVLRELHADSPAREDIVLLFADVLRSQGRLGAASQALFTSCQANGFETDMSLRCAAFARQCDRHSVAARICEGALASGAGSPELLVLAGNVSREVGDFVTARARYLAALDAGADLERNLIFAALANTCRHVKADGTEVARFKRHVADVRYSARSRGSAGFALAKVYDDLADYAAAARTLRDANAMVHSVQSFDAVAWRNFIEARTREMPAAIQREAATTFVPVFIVGVPRSGTTLTATLLARATGARDRGELRALRYIAEQLIAGRHLGDPTALAEAADLYRMLAVQDDPPATWYLDQDPLNFRYLHIAAAMFPQARVIHLCRDRRDTALSLWGQDFAHPDLAFAYDFEDIRAFMAGHDALLRHFVQTLPMKIHELEYETLVREPEAAIAKLADFMGARVIGEGERAESAPVSSASVWQARQPVYSSSIGRWRNYAQFVPELLKFAAANWSRQ